MKFNANVFLTAALVATATAMVACAPAKRGAKFDDRSGSRSGGTEAEKAFGKTRINTPENNLFRDQIISIEAQIEEATDEDESKEKLETLEAEYKAKGVSGLEPVTAKVKSDTDDLVGVKGRQSESNERAKYVMSIHVNIADIGVLDFVGVEETFGDAKALQTLTLLQEDCRKKHDDLRVRAICGDKNCSKLLVQIVKKAEVGNQHLVLEEVLVKAPQQATESEKSEDFKLTVFTALDRTEELLAKKINIVNEMATCKAPKATEEEAKEVEVKVKAEESEADPIALLGE